MILPPEAPAAGPVPPPPDLPGPRARFSADFTGGRAGADAARAPPRTRGH